MQRLLRSFFILFLSVITTAAIAQSDKQTALVRGRLVNGATQQPVSEVQVAIPYLKLLTTSGEEGRFTFSRVAYGTHTLIVGGLSMTPDTFQIVVNAPVVELSDFVITPNEASAAAQQSQQIPTIALEENNLSTDDDGVRTQNVSGLLTASRDPFLNTAAFTFGPYRFQPRGYDRNQQQVLINGAPMNDVETGDAYWSQWGGLNDVFRSRSNTYGLQPSEYTFGGVNGSVYFDATASAQRKQTRISYSLSNRSYRNRLMFTKSSGLMSNGWAYSISLSKRWANEGYIPGTFYNSYSYYAAVSKRIGTKHELNFSAFGSPTKRGKVGPATQEAYDLAGTNFYNPNWGYQNGEKRNAKVADNFQPMFILNYEYKPGERTHWNTTLAYQFGKNKNSAIDWYNGADPRPDYYRNLPSYDLITYGPDRAAATAERWRTEEDYRQIKWDDLYDRNRANVETEHNVDGIAGNDVTGRRSVYVLSNDVDEVKKFVFSTQLQHVANEHLTLSGGLSVIRQNTESYKELADLLGGDFFLNTNQFVARSLGSYDEVRSQYDLNNPNRLVKEGDKYNYDYINHFTKSWLWAQGVFTYNKVDFFISATAGTNSFDREGLYRNGVYQNSFGRSDAQHFTTYGVKGGATYKLNGRNYLFVNGSYTEDAPTVDNTYISVRNRPVTIDDPTTVKTGSVEAGYLLRAPKVNARVVGYATDRKDGVELTRFYLEDAAYQTFGSYVLTHVATRFTGLELALEYKVSASLSVTGVAAVGQAFYTDRAKASIYLDIDTAVVAPVGTKDVYIKNYYLAAGPQSAYTLGFNYRSPKYWYASINFNYFDRNYIDVSPDRRTPEAVEGIEYGSDLWHKVLDQEKLPSVFTVDVFGGKSFLLSRISKKFPRNTYIYLNAGISNLLDNKDIRTGGFEQLRYDYRNNNPDKFPPKYFYGLGRNFFLNLSLKF